MNSKIYLVLSPRLVSFPLGVLKHSDKGNLKEKGFASTHGARTVHHGGEGSRCLKQLLSENVNAVLLLSPWTQSRSGLTHS